MKFCYRKETVAEKNVVSHTRKTGVERYNIENTVGHLHNFTNICVEKCKQVVYTVTSLLLFKF